MLNLSKERIKCEVRRVIADRIEEVEEDGSRSISYEILDTEYVRKVSIMVDEGEFIRPAQVLEALRRTKTGQFGKFRSCYVTTADNLTYTVHDVLDRPIYQVIPL